MPDSFPTLHTDRLTLRPFTVDDAPDLHATVYGDADVTRFLPGGAPRPLERVIETVRYFVEHWTQHGFGGFAVIDTRNDTLIGQCGLNVLAPDGAVELFYAIGRDYWGQGITAEAARAVTAWGFGTVGLARIIALVDADNHTSQRVAQKIGMTFAGRTDHYYNAELNLYVQDAPAASGG
jgi:ribosomal-protein-alanine N-acetyltransferase